MLTCLKFCDYEELLALLKGCNIFFHIFHFIGNSMKNLFSVPGQLFSTLEFLKAIQNIKLCFLLIICLVNYMVHLISKSNVVSYYMSIVKYKSNGPS